jgi:hypothetical protein
MIWQERGPEKTFVLQAIYVWGYFIQWSRKTGKIVNILINLDEFRL